VLGKIYTNSDKEAVLYLYGRGSSVPEISNRLGIHQATVRSWIKKPSINPEDKNFWTEAEDCLLDSELYRKGDIEDVCSIFPNRSWCAINGRAKKLGIKRDIYRHCKLDFTKIDTEFKAYFLGLISADGCVYRQKDRPNSWALSLSLWDVDQELLEKLRDGLNPDIILHRKKSNNPRRHDMVTLAIGDSNLCRTLSTYGIVPRKTHLLKPIQNLSEQLLRHYIRGYFDGDGCVSIDNSKRRAVASICGTQDLLRFIDLHFTSLYAHKVTVREKIGCYTIHYCGNTAQAFLDWIYNGALIYMQRKYTIYEKLKGTEFCYDKNSKRNFSFRQEEEEQVVLAYQAGKSLRYIGNVFNISSNKVKAILLKHNIKTRPVGSNQWSQIEGG
jgi:hypothetical protein